MSTATEVAVPEDLQRRLVRAYLLAVAEPPAPALSAFIAEYGPIAASERVRSGTVPRAVAQETWARRHRTVDAAYLQRAHALGARLIIPEDAGEWPAELLACFEAGWNSRSRGAGPAALWVSGTARLDEALQRSVTIVGSRQPSEHALRMAGDLAYTLAADGVSVVSGAVSGIDAAVHRAALAAGGVSVAILGYGLGVDPPAGHIELLGEIRQRGVVISEYPLDTEAKKSRYLARNRLLAALSQGTVLVEADLRSGAHQAANRAAALGRPVMAVPGQVATPSASACHAMLRTGAATLVTSASEVAETIGRWDIDPARQPAQPGPPRQPGPELAGNAAAVHQALDDLRGKSAQQIAEDCGLPALKVRAVLAELELDGVTERCESGWRRATTMATGLWASAPGFSPVVKARAEGPPGPIVS